MKMPKRKNATAPCCTCGSTSPRAMYPESSKCANERTCNERYCRRRKREDDERAARENVHEQCRATHGQRSIKFCELRVGHRGLHLNGTVEWDGDLEHPLATAIREGLDLR